MLRNRLSALFLSILLLLPMVCVPTVHASEKRLFENEVRQVLDQRPSTHDDYGYGSLVDITGDGVDDLLMVYPAIDTLSGVPSFFCSAYAYIDDNVIPVIKKHSIFCEAGAPNGSVSIIRQEDGTTAVAFWHHEGTFRGTRVFSEGNWNVFTVNNNVAILAETAEYTRVFVDDGQTILYDESTAKLGREDVTYREYEEWENSMDVQLTIKAYEAADGIPLEELLSELPLMPSDEFDEIGSITLPADDDFIPPLSTSISDFDQPDHSALVLTISIAMGVAAIALVAVLILLARMCRSR